MDLRGAKPAHAARRPNLRREMESLCFSDIFVGITQSRTPLPGKIPMKAARQNVPAFKS